MTQHQYIKLKRIKQQIERQAPNLSITDLNKLCLNILLIFEPKALENENMEVTDVSLATIFDGVDYSRIKVKNFNLK